MRGHSSYEVVSAACVNSSMFEYDLAHPEADIHHASLKELQHSVANVCDESK